MESQLAKGAATAVRKPKHGARATFMLQTEHAHPRRDVYNESATLPVSVLSKSDGTTQFLTAVLINFSALFFSISVALRRRYNSSTSAKYSFVYCFIFLFHRKLFANR